MQSNRTYIILQLGAIIGAFLLWALISFTPIYSVRVIELSLWDWLKIVCIYPLLEEYVFRGFLWEELRRKLYPNKAYSGHLIVAVTSLLFLFTHMVFREINIIFFMLISFYLGYLRLFGKRLLVTIATHVFWNFGWLITTQYLI